MPDEPAHLGTCTGRWTVRPAPFGPEIVCVACGSSYSATPARADMALHENYIGTVFDVLACQGVLLLDSAT
jgi:hypothetical protein